MIKLTDILNELSINNPAITPEKVYNYFELNIWLDDIHNNINWNDYIQLCKPYMKKYNIDYVISNIDEFEELSKSDLIKFYNEMRQLVHEYNGKEILNELNVNNPANATPEKVWRYYMDNIWHNWEEFNTINPGWKEFWNLRDSFNNDDDEDIDTLSLIHDKLSQQDLNSFYKEMRKIVKKYVGKEILNELSIAHPYVLIATKSHDDVSSKSYRIQMNEKDQFTIHRHSKYCTLYPSFNPNSLKYKRIKEYLSKRNIKFEEFSNGNNIINMRIPLKQIKFL